ncbi:hypothetical protein [Pseudomonas corrugata]|uniref:hypothetical protein n=1 Tax=Pseudomonas corrugata TaxID=47879 RepID=UPI000A65733F|nr:hypothetical protein [Pseudomonas corrugata]
MRPILTLRHYSHDLIVHSHDHAQLVFGLSGALDFEVEGRGSQVVQQSFVVVPAGAHHACGSPRGSHCLVLDVPDALVDEVGRRLGKAPGINLCYQRPRRLPQWQYNLFCMIHGRQRDRVEAQVQALLAEHLLDDLPHQLLFSTHLFKQCGARFTPPAGARLDG